jgi:predicted NBD/HSP70 family sugar kinase
VKDLVVGSIDLGGTNVRLALINPQGKILYRGTGASVPDRPTMVSLADDIIVPLKPGSRLGWR